MNATEIIGYALDGALYCLDCIENPAECECGELDANGICASNCHGYGPNAVFAGDECAYGTCDGCGEAIGEPEEESDADTILLAFPYDHHDPGLVFEHDQWWVQCPKCGADWSVINTDKGPGFEEVSPGDDTCDAEGE